VNRRAARGGGDCRGVGCVHDTTICAGWRGDTIGALCPIYPRKRTWIGSVMMSALCQKRTLWRAVIAA
jgi:hypothetical protein